MEETIAQYGAVAILFAIAIREFFSYLKNKKTGGDYPTKEACNLKHDFIEKTFGNMSTDLHDIRVNHIDHIEKIHLPNIDAKIEKIFTLLDERLPNRK